MVIHFHNHYQLKCHIHHHLQDQNSLNDIHSLSQVGLYRLHYLHQQKKKLALQYNHHHLHHILLILLFYHLLCVYWSIQ